MIIMNKPKRQGYTKGLRVRAGVKVGSRKALLDMCNDMQNGTV